MYSCSENEKQKRWQEIRKRQHRLIMEADRSTPAHIEQIMKSGFSMTDIKGFFIYIFIAMKIFTLYNEMFNKFFLFQDFIVVIPKMQ